MEFPAERAQSGINHQPSSPWNLHPSLPLSSFFFPLFLSLQVCVISSLISWERKSRAWARQCKLFCSFIAYSLKYSNKCLTETAYSWCTVYHWILPLQTYAASFIKLYQTWHLFVCVCIFDNDLCTHKLALANPPTLSWNSSRMALLSI